MAETTAAATTSTPAEYAAFAPHFVPEGDEVVQPQQSQPKIAAKPAKGEGFESQFSNAADRVAKELGVDTSAVDRADGKDLPPDEPQGEEELEIAGKKLKRKELAAQLREFETLKTKQKEFERASHQRMQEAAEQRKQAASIQAQANEAIAIRARLEHLIQSGADEDTILREFGRDPDKYFQSRIEKQYQDLQKTPEQRAHDQLEAREHAIRQREQAIQEEQHQRQEQVRKYQEEQQTNQQAQQLSQQFMDSANSLKLPRTALTIQRYANAMAAANNAGISVSVEQLGAYVKEQYKQETLAHLTAMESDDDFQALPKTFQDKYRRAQLAKLGNPGAIQTGNVQATPRTKPQKPMSTAEYNAFVQQLSNQRGG